MYRTIASATVGTPLDVVALLSAGGPPGDGAPIEKVNAPATGWPSDDTTRKFTRYVPRAAFSSTGINTSLPLTRTLPACIRLPSGPIRRTLSGTGVTGSLKVSTTSEGGVETTEFWAGLVRSRTACALAGAAIASAPRNPSTAAASSRRGLHQRTRVVPVMTPLPSSPGPTGQPGGGRASPRPPP